MTLVNIISALGNNNSVYPLLVRDCGIENVAKCTMTYKQNKDDPTVAKAALRESLISEYGTSAVWLGGIPLLNKLSDKVIKKCGLSDKVDMALFKGSEVQNLDGNIKKFQDKAPELVKDLVNAKNNKNAYRNAQIGKFAATTIIPIAIMGFLIPKMNFAYTQKKIKESKKQNNQNQTTISKTNIPSMEAFKSQIKSINSQKQNNVNFTGIEKLANLSDLQKMMILDGGLTVGRVKTGRNKAEKAELGFKMAGMCYLNYLAPKTIEKGLNKITKRIFGINTSLDAKLLDDKGFIGSIKDGSLELPKANDEKTLIEFIDSKPKSIFSQQAKKLNIVSYTKDGIRDPRRFVNTKDLGNLSSEIKTFAQDATKSGNIEKFAKKALKAKSFNTIANIGISSFLLAIMLPKAQFLFRKLTTGSKLDPGVSQTINQNKNNQ